MVSLTPVQKMSAMANAPLPVSAADIADGFGSVLERSMQSISSQERNIASLTDELATGKLDNVHKIIVATEQLGLTIQLTTQVRNKAIEAYQEVMRMQL